MIVERLTFQAKYGQGDTLVALMDEMNQQARPAAVKTVRVYTDATGPMFTVQVEFEYGSLPEYAAAMGTEREEWATPEFQEWFAKMVACTERGERQLFNLVSVS